MVQKMYCIIFLKNYIHTIWFAGSSPAEVDGFFQDVKLLGTSTPGGTSSWGSRV